MALADYFERAALAASQILEGFDPDVFEERLASTSVGLAVTQEALDRVDSGRLSDLLIRLLARLYPKLDIWCPDGSDGTRSLSALAKSINPRIEITRDGRAEVGVVVGDVAPGFDTPIFAGASGWDSYLSLSDVQPTGQSGNPLGAGVAACIAAANVFRRVFMQDWTSALDADLVFSTYSFERHPTKAVAPNPEWVVPGDVFLGGVGAIGMATVWALARSPFTGRLHLVDDEAVELSNLQRYVLATRRDVGREKVRVAASALRNTSILPKIHPVDWRTFVSRHGYRLPYALAAFDSVEARREMQASLPKWIANAWTQPGDLGVSVHPAFGGTGACVACLYLPDSPIRNEDELIADALGIPGRIFDVRTLLHLSQPAPPSLLAEIAQGLGIEPERTLAFANIPIRDLYVRGICGGGLIPLGRAGRPHQAVHVPLAHQSALAGILLAARIARVAVSGGQEPTAVARVDLQRPWPEFVQQPALKRGDGRCMCEDGDFIATYRDKYEA